MEFFLVDRQTLALQKYESSNFLDAYWILAQKECEKRGGYVQILLDKSEIAQTPWISFKDACLSAPWTAMEVQYSFSRFKNFKNYDFYGEDNFVCIDFFDLPTDAKMMIATHFLPNLYTENYIF